METLKVLKVEYFERPRGIAYTCYTNVKGITIENDGNGGATYLYNTGSFHNDMYYDMYSETELETLIDEYESQYLNQKQ